MNDIYRKSLAHSNRPQTDRKQGHLSHNKVLGNESEDLNLFFSLGHKNNIVEEILTHLAALILVVIVAKLQVRYVDTFKVSPTTT